MFIIFILNVGNTMWNISFPQYTVMHMNDVMFVRYVALKLVVAFSISFALDHIGNYRMHYAVVTEKIIT